MWGSQGFGCEQMSSKSSEHYAKRANDTIYNSNQETQNLLAKFALTQYWPLAQPSLAEELKIKSECAKVAFRTIFMGMIHKLQLCPLYTPTLKLQNSLQASST